MPGGRPPRNPQGGRPPRYRNQADNTAQRHSNRNHPMTQNLENDDHEFNDEVLVHDVVTPYERKYIETLLNIRIQWCIECRMFSLHHSTATDHVYQCQPCARGTNAKNQPDNNMDPGDVPQELAELTLVEEMVISLIHPQIKVHRIKGSGQLRYSGNTISFPQDVSGFATSLPHRIEQIPLILVSKLTERDGVQRIRDFKIRGPRVLAALRWLKQNNPLYRDVEINMQNVNELPNDGDVSSRLRHIVVPANEPHSESGSEGESETDELVSVNETFVPHVANISNNAEVLGAVHMQYPAMSSTPIDEFNTPSFIPASFPCLFPYGKPCVKQERPIKLTPKAFFTKLIRHKGGRFAKHPSFRFFALNMIQRWQAVTQGNVFVRKNELTNMTIADIKERIRTDHSFLKRVMSYASTIPGTDSYWFKKSSELRSMIDQIGMPTLFFTLSFADLQEPDIRRILDDETGDYSYSQSRLVNDNPLIVDWYFNEKVKFFLDEVVSEIHEVSDSWSRFEWQHRGSPHMHGLLWLNGAPDTSYLDSRDPTEEEKTAIVRYFDRIVTANNPNCDAMPAQIHPSSKRITEVSNFNLDAAELVNRVQRHIHNRLSCIRKKRGSNVEYCRFNFPQEVRDQPALLSDPTTKRYTFFPRRNDPLINKFSMPLMRVWRANMDISPVTSRQALIQYVAKYTAKAENSRSETFQSMIELVLAQQNDSGTVPSLIRKFMCKAVGRDMSQQEVCHLLLGLPLVISSRVFQSIRTLEDEWVSLRGEDEEEDDEMPKDSIGRYRKRPTRMEGLSFLQFSIQQTVYKKHGRLNYGDRRKQAVIQVWPKFELGKGNDEKYYEQQILLHHPHRQVSDVKSAAETWEDAHSRLLALPAAGLGIDWENIDAETDEPVLHDQENADYFDWMALVAAGPSGDMPDVELGRRDLDVQHNWNDSFHSYPNIPSLEAQIVALREQSREQQERAAEQMPPFALAAEQQAVIDHLTGQLNGTITQQQCVLIQGPAGSGKSAVIQAMKATCDSMRQSNFPEFLCVAPTGAAAINVFGSTVHSLFRLPVRIDKFGPLRGEPKLQFEAQLAGVKVVIMDEFSMARPAMFAMMNDRLQSATGSHLPFGGIFIYLVGDIFQLPPVLAPAVFSNIGPNANILDVRGRDLFRQQFKKAFILNANHRQVGADQQHFREILFNLSRGQHLSSVQALLNSRLRGPNHDISEHCIISHTKDVVIKTNKDKLERTFLPVALILSKNVPRESGDADCGLPSILQISVDARVVLLYNLSVTNGLANGTQGVVRDIVYKPGTSSPDDMPLFVMVQFDRTIGLPSNTVPIAPVSRSFIFNNQPASRLQIPLALAWAFTTHKSQGMTLPRTVVNITNEFSAGLAYVALSRVTTLSGLLLENEVTMEILQSIRKKGEKKLGEFNRIANLASNH